MDRALRYGHPAARGGREGRRGGGGGGSVSVVSLPMTPPPPPLPQIPSKTLTLEGLETLLTDYLGTPPVGGRGKVLRVCAGGSLQAAVERRRGVMLRRRRRWRWRGAALEGAV